MSTNLKIDLKKRVDQDGMSFYVGKIKAPMNIDCRNGVTFLVFVSDDGEEQLQIAPLQNREQSSDKDSNQDKRS